MKSRVVVPSVYLNQMKKETRSAIAEELKSYKDRVTNIMLAAFMLTAHEAWGIGSTRMQRGLDTFTEYLNFASEYINMGIGDEMLMSRLKNCGLWELYDYILNGDDDNGESK